MNNTVENDFFGFPKVKWLQYTGEVGKCTSYRYQIFARFNTPKIIKIGYKIKRWTFFGTQCISSYYCNFVQVFYLLSKY